MAQIATIINKFGTLKGWNSVRINMLGRTLEGVTELEYNDNVDMDVEYGAGGYPQGKSVMNYKATASVTVFTEELEAIQASLPPGVRIQDIPDFPIVSIYDLNGTAVKDIIQNVTIKNVGKAVKQGDGKMTHKFELVPSHIDWKTT